MTKSRITMVLATLAMLVACGQQESQSSEAAGESTVLVEVDGKPVTLTMLEQVMEARGVTEDDQEGMRETLDALIRMQVVANAARREGLTDDPQIEARIRLAELQTVNRLYLGHAQETEAISEQAMRDVYDAQLARSGDTQYRIEIIGYEDQARALNAINRLQDGEVEYSTLRAEAEAAGLPIEQPGWIDRSQVPEDFAALLAESGESEVVPRPLESSRGSFLVRVLDQRGLEAPSFEEVREGIARSLRQEQRQALVDSLYDQAEIKPMLPLEDAEPDAEQQQ